MVSGWHVACTMASRAPLVARRDVERMAREIEIEFERFNNARRALERELEIEAERAKRGAR